MHAAFAAPEDIATRVCEASALLWRGELTLDYLYSKRKHLASKINQMDNITSHNFSRSIVFKPQVFKHYCLQATFFFLFQARCSVSRPSFLSSSLRTYIVHSIQLVSCGAVAAARQGKRERGRKRTGRPKTSMLEQDVFIQVHIQAHSPIAYITLSKDDKIRRCTWRSVYLKCCRIPIKN